MRRALTVVLTLTLATAGLGVVAPAAEPRTCLVVDTDAGLDDYRALAVVAPARDVRAVVVTEGISGVRDGATAVSLFLAGRGMSPPVLPGLAAPNPPAYDWLPPVRAAAERMNGFLGAPVPAVPAAPARVAAGVRAAVHGCGRVEVLVLGPWTSYPVYAAALGHARVVASGRSFAENNPDNFNCEYDLAACRAAPRSAVYVDLPAAPAYEPTQEMVDRLRPAGLPGLLKAVLDTDPAQWAGTRLWDDTAALSLVAPSAFGAVGGHLEPRVDEDELRGLLVAATNR